MDEFQKMIRDHEERIRKLESFYSVARLEPAKPAPIREFLLASQPRSEVEKTFFIAYFLEQNQRLESFNTTDLSDGFREAKESVPANINLAVIGNVQKGFFMQAKDKKNGLKAWTLTNSGLNYFDSKISSRHATD